MRGGHRLPDVRTGYGTERKDIGGTGRSEGRARVGRFRPPAFGAEEKEEVQAVSQAL